MIPKIIQTTDYRWLNWETSKLPHFLIVGGSGSGKTYFEKLLLGKISRSDHNSLVILCDFKGDESLDYQQAFRFHEVEKGLDIFLNLFHARWSNQDKSKFPIFLCFDELGAYITSLDRKTADKVKKQLALVLMMGRSFHCHLIITLQRADASYFTNGGRDNFAIRLGLGKLSTESHRMLFPDTDSQDFANFVGGRGSGVIYRDGFELEQVVVPTVSRPKFLDSEIVLLLTRLMLFRDGGG